MATGGAGRSSCSGNTGLRFRSHREACWPVCAILACGLVPWDYDRSEVRSVPYCALCPGPSCPLLRLAKTPWVARGSFLCWRRTGGGGAGGHCNLRRGVRAEGGSFRRGAWAEGGSLAGGGSAEPHWTLYQGSGSPVSRLLVLAEQTLCCRRRVGASRCRRLLRFCARSLTLALPFPGPAGFPPASGIDLAASS